jgi:hypothetical protein
MIDMTTAKNRVTSTGKRKRRFDAIMYAIGYTANDVAKSDDGQAGTDEDNDEADTELNRLSDDYKPGWATGTITETVQHGMESFWLRQIRLDELTQPAWGDAANHFRERDMNFGTAKLNFPAVFKPQMDTTVATPSPTIVGEYM